MQVVRASSSQSTAHRNNFLKSCRFRNLFRLFCHKTFLFLLLSFLFLLQQGKFNPQYMKGSPHSSQRGGAPGSMPVGSKRSQTPDHMLNSGMTDQGGVEMKPLHQVQTSMATSVHSPSVAQKVSRMGVPTPFAGITSVPSPIRYYSWTDSFGNDLNI